MTDCSKPTERVVHCQEQWMYNSRKKMHKVVSDLVLEKQEITIHTDKKVEKKENKRSVEMGKIETC